MWSNVFVSHNILILISILCSVKILLFISTLIICSALDGYHANIFICTSLTRLVIFLPEKMAFLNFLLENP